MVLHRSPTAVDTPEVRTSKRFLSNGLDDRRRRTPDRSGGVAEAGALVVVVDGVEDIEARHGATALAEVLRVAGHRIRTTLRHDDFTARWGGEELVVVLRDVSLETVVEVGQRLRIAISQPITVFDGSSIVPTCSVGAADGEADRVEELIDRAHLALQLAKDCGGNCVRRALGAKDRRTAGVAAGG
jgi:diguanylate cyclase (GGDEF)-like protein